MEDWTYHVKIGPLMTHDFKVRNGRKQVDGLAPTLFTAATK